MAGEENLGHSSPSRDEPRFRSPENSPGIHHVVIKLDEHLAVMRSDINLILSRLDRLSAVLEHEAMKENRPVSPPAELPGRRSDDVQLRQVRRGLSKYGLQVALGLLVGVIAVLVVIFLFRGVR